MPNSCKVGSFLWSKRKSVTHTRPLFMVADPGSKSPFYSQLFLQTVTSFDLEKPTGGGGGGVHFCCKSLTTSVLTATSFLTPKFASKLRHAISFVLRHLAEHCVCNRAFMRSLKKLLYFWMECKKGYRKYDTARLKGYK